MKLLPSRWSLTVWLYVSGLFLTVLAGFSPQTANAQNYPQEYIYIQPVVSGPIREGDSISIDLEYAFGQDALDAEPVYWYRNGVLVGTSVSVLQTYTSATGPRPKLWDPYKGLAYPEEADPATATINSTNAAARWLAVFTATEPGMYRAKIGNVGNSNRWTYTNFVQVAMVPKDPSRALEIVRNPPSQSVSGPGSDPLSSIKIYGDMRSHIQPLMNTPFGAATDSEGFTYVADTQNHCIRRVSPGGHVTTFAGIDGQPSRRTEPSLLDLAVPKRNARTRKEREPTPDLVNGVVNQSTNLADGGYRFASSISNTFLSEPKFDSPEALAVSDIGVIYVADTANHSIRRIWSRIDVDNSKVPPERRSVVEVETMFGDENAFNLRSPRGICFSGSSSDPTNPPVLYVLNSADYTVKKLFLNASDGSLDTSKGDTDPFFPSQKTGCQNIAGLGATPGWQGVPVSGSEARFYSPRGIVAMTDKTTGAETIYIADTVNHVIRQLTKENGTWIARTVVGFVGAKGNINAVGTAARLHYPVGLALDETRRLLYFTEFGNHSLRRIHLPGNARSLADWTVDLVAGSGYYGPVLFGPNGPQGTGNGDGFGRDAVFYYPAGISFNKMDGSIMLADSNNHCLRKVSISNSGSNAWTGESKALAGSVGVSGNRSFEEMEEFQYRWKKDAVFITDRNTSATNQSFISGTVTDTLRMYDLQYEDAGVYALVVANNFDEQVELPQAFVYVATTGDPPAFMNPGYRVESQADVGVPLVEFQKGMDIFVYADVLPSDQVTYQWMVAEELYTGNYNWIALSDLPLNTQILAHPDLERLLGKNTQQTSGMTISGANTSRLAIEKLQSSLTTGRPPKLRFRVDSFTKTVVPLPLDTKVPVVSLNATWSVSLPPALQKVTVGSDSGLSKDMYLVGTGLAPESKITNIETIGASVVLTLDTPALLPGSGIQVTATNDLSSGIEVAVKHPVFMEDPRLSFGKGAGVPTPLPADRTVVDASVSQQIQFALSAGIGAAPGNPAPSYQWYKKTSLAGTPVALVGQTGLSYSNPSVQSVDRAYYFVRISNTVDGQTYSVDSNTAYLDVTGPQTLQVLDMNLDAGGVTQNVQSLQPRLVDKTKSPELRLIVNIDAPAQPTYSWTFVRDSDNATLSSSTLSASLNLSTYGASFTNRRTYGELYFANLPDDADGVFRVKITLGTGSTAKEATCSWRVTVQHLPEFVPSSKVFKVGNSTPTDTHTVNLSEVNSLLLSASFKSPPTLPLTYRWRRNGLVVGGTSNTFQLNRITIKDLGTYRLEVTNALGTRVFGITNAGENPFPVSDAGWTLKASGKPSVTVQPTAKVLLTTNPNVNPALAGTIGAAPKVSALLALNTAAAQNPLNPRVAIGQRIALQVAVAGDPAPTYQWWKAGYGAADFSQIPGATSAIYVAPPAAGPAGETSKTRYKVYAKNSEGDVWSEEITVQTEGIPDPRVTASSSLPWAGGTAAFPTGTTVTLTANVTDLQAAYTYQWRLNGNPIFGAVSNKLVLPNIVPSQTGNYSVVATGVAGSKQTTYVVSVATSSSPTVTPYSVTFDGTNALKSFLASPTPTSAGFLPGTRVSLIGQPPADQMLQAWRLSYTDANQTVEALLPARAGQFVMPAANVTITPVVSRSFTGSYTGLLSLDAPWDTAEGMEWGTLETAFRPAGLLADPGKIRGLFTCTVSSLGAVSGQIQLENKTYSFTSVLDAGMSGNFRISTTLKGTVWNMTGRLSFNPTEENRLQSYVDNVLHVTLTDALLATPPVVQVGQTLYCAAAGFSGAADALRADVTEGILADSIAPAAPGASDVGTPNPATSVNSAPASIQAAAPAPAAAPTDFAIVINPLDFFTSVGGLANFIVTVRGGTPPYFYEWRRYGPQDSVLGTLVRTFSSIALTDILPLSNIQNRDSGVYQVEITDSNGARLTSTRAVLSLSGTTNPGGGTAPQLSPPMVFTAAVYRRTNGSSFGQSAVLSTQVRFGTGTTVVMGYLANGTRFTLSTFLGRPFVIPLIKNPQEFETGPDTLSVQPFVPTATALPDQAAEALSENLFRRSSSQSIPLWVRGDASTEPVFGTMVFNGPRVYGSLGVLNTDSSSKFCIYTPNALAGYFFDPAAPYLANVSANQFVANQQTVTMTTPDAYTAGLVVEWSTPGTTPLADKVYATVDGTTGLLFGGLLETTINNTTTRLLPRPYVQYSPPYSPKFAAYKATLACTTAGVTIQKPEILPGYVWTTSRLGGYVGFIYRGKNWLQEPLKNVLGTGTPESANLNRTITERIEPFLINIPEQD